MVDYSRLEFVTSHDTDKVVDVLKGSITIPSMGNSDETIPYNKGFLPLPTTKWSTDPTFSLSYDGGATDATGKIYLDIRSNTSNNLEATYYNSSASSVTLYYTVYIFIPNDVDIELPPLTDVLAEDLVFLTNYNYSKVLFEGFTNSASYVYTHNLGYHTQVEAWYQRDLDNLWVRQSNNEDDPNPVSPTVDTTVNSVSFNDDGLINHPLNWYIKIYLDEV